MPAWEYVKIVHDHRGAVQSIMQYFNGNRLKLGDASEDTFSRVLTEMGKAGWELVGSASVSDDKESYIFKRLKEG